MCGPTRNQSVPMLDAGRTARTSAGTILRGFRIARFTRLEGLLSLVTVLPVPTKGQCWDLPSHPWGPGRWRGARGRAHHVILWHSIEVERLGQTGARSLVVPFVKPRCGRALVLLAATDFRESGVGRRSYWRRHSI